MKKSNYTIAGIGELLWDLLPESESLGGAPVNFAHNVSSLGNTGIPLSTIGYDPRGDRALELLAKNGVETRGISRVQNRDTGYVRVKVDQDGIAGYFFPENVAWDQLQINTYGRSVAKRLDGICFGTLAQRSRASRETIYHYLDSLPAHTVKIYDSNLRQNFYSRGIIASSLERADILKLNDEELHIISKLLQLTGSAEKVIQKLLNRYDLELVIVSKGDQGSLLVTADSFSSHPGVDTRVVDTIGAGDAFAAAATIGFLQGLSLDEINDKASRVAAFVCSQMGAITTFPEHLT